MHLRQIIKELQHHRFGRCAETLPEDQIPLGLEDVDQAAASSEAASEAAVPNERTRRAAKRRMNCRSLPRIEMVIDIEDHSYPCMLPCAALDRRGPRRAAGHRPGATACAGRAPSQVCLPGLRRGRGAGTGTGAADRGQAADRPQGRATVAHLAGFKCIPQVDGYAG